MALRPIQLPGDLPIVADLAIRGFQYPENEAWSVQSDNAEQIASLLKSVQRLWPLIWFVRLISPAMRDNFHGFLWEENGEAVGVVNFQRQGMTEVWHLVNVALLPEHRRRGIGRKLVEATVDWIRKREGKLILLDVIAGNLPACTLYEQLGFEYHTGTTTLSYEREEPPITCDLKNGYTLLDDFSDWRVHYGFERQITPDAIQQFDPVAEDDFHGPVKTVMETIWRWSGTQRKKLAVSTTEGEIVAVGRYSARLRAGGVNNLSLRVDPAHPELAPFLMRRLLYTTLQSSPGRRIEFLVPNWQNIVIEAALDAGSVKLYEEHRMGKTL